MSTDKHGRWWVAPLPPGDPLWYEDGPPVEYIFPPEVEDCTCRTGPRCPGHVMLDALGLSKVRTCRSSPSTRMSTDKHGRSRAIIESTDLLYEVTGIDVDGQRVTRRATTIEACGCWRSVETVTVTPCRSSPSTSKT